MTDEEKRIYLLYLRVLKLIQGGKAVKLNRQGKRMKVTFNLPKNGLNLNNSQMAKVLELIKLDIQSRTPEDTGQLKRSIKAKVLGTNKGQIFISGKRNNEVALYQHDGTVDHFIKPKSPSGSLHWVEGGKHFFSKGHMVRGIEPTQFFKPSKRVLGAVERLVKGFFNINFR